jgi:transposase
VGHGRDRLDQHQGAPVGGRRQRWVFAQAIGTSRGGRASKLHGLTDHAGRPRVLLISPGNASDMTMAPALIEAAQGRFDRLIADRGYDSNAFRAALSARGTAPCIPSRKHRKQPVVHDAALYRQRYRIERACSAASRTGAASPPATTAAPIPCSAPSP